MEKQNRYRNRIGLLALARLVAGGVLLLAAGTGFVLVRNEHVLVGREIRAFEDQISESDREIEMWELRIAGVRDRQELARRLRWVQSDLAEIDQHRVIEVTNPTQKHTEEASAPSIGAVPVAQVTNLEGKEAADGNQ